MIFAAISALYSGGPGSGCQGPNCGRPKGAGGHDFTKRQRERLMKKYATKIPKEVPGIVKEGKKQTIAIQQSPRRAIKQSFFHRDGYQYTVIKSPRARGEKIKDPLSGKSKFHGQFAHEYEIPTYDKAALHSWSTAQNEGERGQSLFVRRDYVKNNVVIQEISFDQDRDIERTRQYKFRNFGRAAGFLNKRYGVRLKAPKVGWRG